MDRISDEEMESLREAMEEYMKASRKLMTAVLEMEPTSLPQDVMMAALGVALADHKVGEVGGAIRQKIEEGGDYDLNLDDIQSQTIRTKVEEFRHGPVPNAETNTPDNDYGRKE